MRWLSSLQRIHAVAGAAGSGRWMGIRVYKRARRFTPYIRQARDGGVAVDVRTRLVDFTVPRAWARERRDRPLYESSLVAAALMSVRARTWLWSEAGTG